MDVERPVVGEQRGRGLQPRREEAEVVLEGVLEGERGEQLRPIAAPAEARAIAVRVGRHAQRAALAAAPGVERRVDVDEVEGAVGQPREDVGVVALDEQVLVEADGLPERGGLHDFHPRGR